jgi:hypothetical protein
MARFVSIVVVLIGLSMLSGIWPLPNQQVADFRAETSAQLATANKIQNPSAFDVWEQKFLKIQLDNPYLEAIVWGRWILELATATLCMLAGMLMYFRTRLWTVLILLATISYERSTGFFLPIYGLFFKNCHSFERLQHRVAIVSAHPSLLFDIIWFNLLAPTTLSLASIMAMMAIYRKFNDRRTGRRTQ